MSFVNSIGLLSIAIGAIATINYINNNNVDSINSISKLILNTLLGNSLNLKKPILWFVVDDYGTNNRRWADFGARSSRDLNLGFLAITKARCFYTQGVDFDIRVCLGRDAVAKIIYENRGIVPEYHLSTPPELWRAWARSALLSLVGGLYFDGLSLCLGPSFMSDVLDKSDAVFGTSYSDLRTHTFDGTCSPHTGWASGPNHRMWKSLHKETVDLINAGPTSWTSAIARNQISTWYDTYLRNSMPTIRHTEWSRRADGKPIELEDLFGRALTDDWTPPQNAIYIPLDYESINRSVTYKWFLSLSTEEIINPKSNFLWASLSQNIRHHK